jgi:hypothetical protein
VTHGEAINQRQVGIEQKDASIKYFVACGRRDQAFAKSPLRTRDILHDTMQPWLTVASDWPPKGLCPK